MTSMVARLRRAIENESRVVGTVSYRYTDDLDTLLSIVERFAALSDPYDDGCDICPYCGENISDNPSGETKPEPGTVHAPDCPWQSARRACGMDES